MNIAATLTGSGAVTGTPLTFSGPVRVVTFQAAKTAIADATEVQLSDAVAPVGRRLSFIVRIEAITAYANGDGAAPAIVLKGSATNATTAITAAGDAAGSTRTIWGVLEPNEKLSYVPTAGTGTTETGTARITVTLIDPIAG